MTGEIKEKKIHGQLKAMLDSLIEGVVVLDISGRITLVNRAFEEMFEIREDQAAGHALIEAVRNPELDSFLKDALETQRTREIELEMITPVERIFKIRAAFFGKEEEGKTGLLAVFYDVTEIRKLERAKTEFVANVSHELRTPLASIKGFTETLLEGALDDKKNNRKFLGIIQENVNRLDRLIGDILELSKMEPVQLKPVKEFLNIKEVIEKTVEILRPAWKKKNIKVEVRIPVNFPQACANKDMLEQVFINLMDNALKFNKEGGSLIVEAEETPGAIKVSVKDTGLGIPEQDQFRIFERFYRVDKGRSRELGGTGLGLSIVKHIIELHGGTVDVESKINEGSIFYFNLPKV
ncbi:MAG: ATP-binding protein [Candidatus Firestonebacteria bacterium]